MTYTYIYIYIHDMIYDICIYTGEAAPAPPLRRLGRGQGILYDMI